VCHTTLMVMVPGLGDDIQAIKAGVMEVGDVFVVNQADRDGARKTAREVNAMLDVSHRDWRPPVKLASALKREGLDELWEALGEHRAYMEGERGLERRVESAEHELLSLAQERLTRELKAGLHTRANDSTQVESLRALAERVARYELDPYAALTRLFG
jgi:LAO/AO transport system kinase